ncbi:MAG: hypothetical protein B1H06_05445 [Candidatus Cloacimonas sp. 4484_143]|nr:MAG: hypothetical protein B1H06_05445 [Candidatus Cloacimonas sp. 4484_143]RLC52258.1 MAG: hypothetical protein DRI23_03205 [Candidatus Cloacimonadota bacterium]
MKRILLIMILILTFALNAEMINNVFKPNLLMPSFLDANKISVNHSISFSSGISSNKQSFYQSVYTNHLSYNFNSKLKLDLDLNFVNFGTATYKSGIEFDGNEDNATKVLPNMQLNWKPSENTSITIEFKQYNSPFDFSYRD